MKLIQIITRSWTPRFLKHSVVYMMCEICIINYYYFFL